MSRLSTSGNGCAVLAGCDAFREPGVWDSALVAVKSADLSKRVEEEGQGKEDFGESVKS